MAEERLFEKGSLFLCVVKTPTLFRADWTSGWRDDVFVEDVFRAAAAAALGET